MMTTASDYRLYTVTFRPAEFYSEKFPTDKTIIGKQEVISILAPDVTEAERVARELFPLIKNWDLKMIRVRSNL